MNNNIANHDRLICYLWHERSKPKECKFGEVWINTGKDVNTAIWDRIKESVGVRKDLCKSGPNGEEPEIQLFHYWDCTEYAKKNGLFYKHARVDDHIRKNIGHRKGNTGEVHSLSPQDVKLRIDKFFTNYNLPLPNVGLAAWQAHGVENIIDAFRNGKQFILADLCARFGKTMAIGAIISEMNIPLTIVASYVLTSFSSFRNDFSGYKQFRNMVLINTEDFDWKDQVNAVLKEGKQAVVFMSLCNGSRRQSKIDFLFNKKVNRLVVVDEADYGAHKPGQAKPLKQAMKSNDKCIIMTGTNADRAVKLWDIDHLVSVVYPELVMEKNNPQKKYTTTLKNFLINSDRHDLVCDISFYQMNLKRLVEKTMKTEPDLFDDGTDNLPSWSKVAANPIKAKGFITAMMPAIFSGRGGFDELNIDIQTNSSNNKRVAMFWLPGSITNKNFDQACNYIQEALPNMKIIRLYGEETDNAKSEKWVKEQIEKAQMENRGVLIVTARLGQRSFSVPDITEIYLAYDSGEIGSTIQKISRALTPQIKGKIGRIISLSFDPNRDDKFDSIILETAINYKNSRKIPSAPRALQDVLRTIDIFACAENGAVKIDRDTYLEQVIARNSIASVTGQVANLNHLNSEQIEALARGNFESFQSTKVEATMMGKTGLKNKKHHSNKNITPTSAKLLAKARKVIASIVESIDVIILGTEERNIMKALKKVMKSNSMSQEYFDETGVDISLVHELFVKEVINKDFVELQLHKLVN